MVLILIQKVVFSQTYIKLKGLRRTLESNLEVAKTVAFLVRLIHLELINNIMYSILVEVHQMMACLSEIIKANSHNNYHKLKLQGILEVLPLIGQMTYLQL